MRWRRMRGIRGATTAAADTPEAILASTRELLQRMVELNELEQDDLVSIFFTLTPDLTSTFPAGAARDLGWTDVPLLCMTEIAVPGALERCIRVLMHVECPVPRGKLSHVYLHEAEALRPDLPVPAAAGGNHGRALEAMEGEMRPPT